MKGRLPLYFLGSILFLLSGIVSAYFSLRQTSSSSLAENVADNLGRELSKADEDLSIAAAGTTIDPDMLSYPVCVFENGALRYWSDNTFVPSIQQVADTFDVKLVRTGSEAYLLRKRSSGDRVLVSVIQLYRKYPISNDYFSPEYNKKILPSSQVSIYEASSTQGDPICIRDRCYFRIVFQDEAVAPHGTLHVISFILILIALFSFVGCAYYYLKHSSWCHREEGFLFLLLVFIALRALMIVTGFPGDFVRSPLFDPQEFAVSTLNASLGDLFINLLVVLALAFYLFRSYYHFRMQRWKSTPRGAWITGAFSALMIFFSGLFPVVVIQTLYNNSSIIIDISQSLTFDILRLTALLAVLIAAICSFLVTHVFLRTLASLKERTKIFTCLIAGAVVFVGINEFSGQRYYSTFLVTVLFVAIVFGLSLFNRLNRLTFETFAYFFVAIFFLAMNGAYTIQYFTQKEKIENQFRFASNFLIDRDIFAEYLLSEAARKIAADAFIQSRISSPFLGKDAIRQKIRQVFLPSYFNKYDIDIYIFDGTGQPVDYGSAALSDFVAVYDKDAYRTQYQGIRFIDNPASDVAQKYLVLIPIARAGVTNSHVAIELSLKRIIPENVYPELLVDYSFQQFYKTQDLSYAVFANSRQAFSSGEFNYDRFLGPDALSDPRLYSEGIVVEGFDHIAVKDQSDRLAVVSSRETPFIHRLSNFSFLFTLGLLIVLVMIFVQGIFQYFRGSRLFFSARIQLYLNLAFFIPLIVISIGTLSLTSRSSQEQLNEEYLNKSRNFGEQMTNYLDEEDGGGPALDVMLTDLAKLSNLDANIYDPSGVLMATSQPMIFERNLLSPYINAGALARIRAGETLFVGSETAGSLGYFISYSVLKSSQRGDVVGILAIPFFQSAYLLEKIQSVLLINILNIFALIFIILLLLSYIVADRLTFPLRFITQSLRRTSLTRINTPLTWPAEDEIGFMVKEYNAMLYKLSESKTELEQTQREKAWREIAQQVAHEIKNPLTPMKLTLQQLERNLQAGNASIEKTQKAIITLLGQVDTLNEIASSFSGFVKMPEPVMQRVDVIAILRRAVDLHSPTGNIQVRSNVKEAWVSGDAQLLSRTFSNLILNALQSARPGQSVSVDISAETTADRVRLMFRDNGKGIEPRIADRVFLPHFSTKQSGSGLGLAIAKQGIEQMRGRIWFETGAAGTTFFIELPLLQR